MGQLGLFYEMLLDRGRGPKGTLLTPQTVEALTTPHRVGLLDQTFKHKLDWGLGFIVNSEHYGAEMPPYGYGRHASRRTFGHSGFQSSVGFADPVHGLCVAIAVNGNPGEPRHTERFRQLTEAVYEDLGLAPQNP
jgi:CubicO group peptidase (beta-lactamase class C family)